jgi:hypothetical protein
MVSFALSAYIHPKVGKIFIKGIMSSHFLDLFQILKSFTKERKDFSKKLKSRGNSRKTRYKTHTNHHDFLKKTLGYKR